MKTVTKEKREYVHQTVLGVACDRCKADLHVETSDGAFKGGALSISFGWGSAFDTEFWTGQLCDDCAAWLREQLPTLEVA